MLFVRLAAERRREPRDDVISLLAAAEQDGRLAARDLAATCGLLLVAGFETTVNLIGNGLAALQRDQSQWHALVADPARAEAVVEEALRFAPRSRSRSGWPGRTWSSMGCNWPRARCWP